MGSSPERSLPPQYSVDRTNLSCPDSVTQGGTFEARIGIAAGPDRLRGDAGRMQSLAARMNVRGCPFQRRERFKKVLK